jgi:anti-anti-sigma factor
MAAPGVLQPKPFTANCVRTADQVVLRVSGRLVDPYEAQPTWRACLPRLTAADVRVDLGDVTEMDARGLGMLAELTRETRAIGGHIAVVSASPRVRRLLRLTHMDGLLESESGIGPRIAA